jgi:PAS domain-containing protein
VAYALGASQGLQAQLQAASASSGIYEVSITDHEGRVLASTDKSLVGKFPLRRPPITQLTQRGILNQLKVLAGPRGTYEFDFQFNYGEAPFGEVRVAVSSALLLNNEILPIVKKLGTIVLLALLISTILAAVVSGATLAPLARISEQLDRISAGQYDAPVPEVAGFAGSGDELGQVSRKITQVGQQLRGVHEIFSTMRENMNSVMAGLEDGLLLFTRDARAVMVSPAAEKFLGAPAGQFLGRRVTEIFPIGHPLRDALRIEGDELRGGCGGNGIEDDGG